MKLVRSKERTEQYQQRVKSIWAECYRRNIWRTTHQAGSEKKNIELAKREMDLFIFPTEQKCQQLLNDKEANPCPTFHSNFSEHKSISRYLPVFEKLVALDYGCGSLIRYTTAMSPYFKKVIGVDSSPEALVYAQQYKLDNIELIEVDGTSLKEIEDESIDFVFSNLVFQHCGNLEIMVDIINEMYRVLKSGGVLRVSYWTEEKKLDHQDVYHGTGFSVEGYKEMFEEVGFVVETQTHEKPVMWVTLIK